MRLGYIIAGLLALVLSSCSTISHTAYTSNVNEEIHSLTMADLNISSQRVSTTRSWKWNPFRHVSVSNEQKSATATLVNENNADILVEPQYEVKRGGLFRGGSVTVSGRPATYKNFRPMTKADAETITTLKGTKCIHTESAPHKRKAKKSFKDKLKGLKFW